MDVLQDYCAISEYCWVEPDERTHQWTKIETYCLSVSEEVHKN
jgi:hypothetical protein